MPALAWAILIITTFLSNNRAYLLFLKLRRKHDDEKGMKLVADFERQLQSDKVVARLLKQILVHLTRYRR